jgi:glycosyltransferase involved in cell wall biosynthesis
LSERAVTVNSLVVGGAGIRGEPMSDVPATASPQAKVVVLGRVPPPVTGMTLFTQKILEQMQAVGPVDFINWSIGATKRTAITRVRYAAKSFRSWIELLRRGRVKDRRLYLVSNSGAGLYSTAALTWLAARLGYSIYLHHHVYNYIDQYDRRMARIDRWMGPCGVHVVACRGMIRDFQRQYHTPRRFAIVRPSAVVVKVGSPRRGQFVPLRLGMLSNLSLAKGLDQAIETFAELHRAGRPVTLTLAGPALDRAASRLITRTLADYPGHVHYLGAVYNEAKSRFFAGIDVLLFPTQQESWGMVLHEALAVGIPVIANDRGCTALVVGEKAGLVVHRGEDFVESAGAQLARWQDQPAEYAAASSFAIEQADFLNREGQRTLAEFARHMFSPPGAVEDLLLPT